MGRELNRRPTRREAEGVRADERGSFGGAMYAMCDGWRRPRAIARDGDGDDGDARRPAPDSGKKTGWIKNNAVDERVCRRRRVQDE